MPTLPGVFGASSEGRFRWLSSSIRPQIGPNRLPGGLLPRRGGPIPHGVLFPKVGSCGLRSPSLRMSRHPRRQSLHLPHRALLRVLPARSPRHRQALSRAVSLHRLPPRSSVPRRPFPNSLPSRKLPISRPLSRRLRRSLPTLRMRRPGVPSRAKPQVSVRAHPVRAQRQALRPSRRCVPSRALLRLP